MHSTNIGVEVKNGIVTLSGTVHSWADKNMVTHTAWGTKGVHKVTDNMTFSY